jgi:hypothetical protein
MDEPSPSLRELARRLLAESRVAGNSRAQDAALVSERLRASLTQFAGAYGFAALRRRALALASSEVPALRSVSVSADGHLMGLEQLGSHAVQVREDAAVAITAHLLSLLVTFVGEPLALRLVRQNPLPSVDEEHEK